MDKAEILKRIEEIATKSNSEELQLKALDILYHEKIQEGLDKSLKINQERLKAFTDAWANIGE